MRITTWKQNLTDKSLWGARWSVTAWDDSVENEIASLSAEAVIPRRPRAEFGARLHFGSRHSETPIDAHLRFAGAGLYVSSTLGRRFADWISRGSGRDLSVSVHSGRLWWKVWVGKNHPHAEHVRRWGKYRSWSCRDGCVSTNPVEWFLGRRRYFYECLDTASRHVDIDGRTHPVELTLQRMTVGFAEGRRRRDKGLVCDWSCRDGIPTHRDTSGWKGTTTHGAAFRMPEWAADRAGWPEVAAARLVSWVKDERVRTGWTREHEEAE